MPINTKDSFTSADSLPFKLLRCHSVISEIAKTGRIVPYHVQFIPTNRCNMHCDFCSCADDDRKTQMAGDKIFDLIPRLVRLGTKAVTITGGGEPTLHSDFDAITRSFFNNSIEMGLVTNGLLLHKQKSETLSRFVWCRISNGDFRTFTDSYAEGLAKTVLSVPNVGWAFSHVVSPTPNYEEIKRVVLFANTHAFTHVRLVADLYHPQDVPMESVHTFLVENGVDISKVVFQDRANPVKGGDCRICYLKPLISAEGRIYMCCGVQYAIAGKARKMPEELCMGSIENIEDVLWDLSHIKKGNQCDKCYYKNYNRVLASMVQNLEHANFL